MPSNFQVLQSFTNPLFQVLWQQLVSPSPSYSILFQFSSKVKVLISLFAFFSFTQWSARAAKSKFRQVLFFFFFCRLSLGLVVRPRLGDQFLNPIEVYVSHSLGGIPGCAYTTCSYCQISIFCTIPSWLPSPPFRIKSYTLFIIIIYSLRVFHISVSWWSFTEVWVTASLLKSPGLISVFWARSQLCSSLSSYFQILQSL